jgi:hypothetical protein
MRLRPNQIGGPVVDLKGRVIGITVARADRTRSFVMPATAIARMLENEATDPSLANQREENATPPMRIGRMDPPQDRAAGPNTEQRMRRHLTEMQQLMDYMLEEMSQLEEGR